MERTGRRANAVIDYSFSPPFTNTLAMQFEATTPWGIYFGYVNELAS